MNNYFTEGKEYGFPYIPLSQLREMYRTAQTLALEDDCGKDEKWIWYILIRQEVDRRMIEYYQTKLYYAATDTGIEEHDCSLCTYENGVLIKKCEMHRQIDELEELIFMLTRTAEASVNLINEIKKENKEIKEQNQKLINTIANYIHKDWPEWKEIQPNWPVRK